MTEDSQIDQPLLGVVLDSIADGVFTVDEDFRITYFNRAAEQITGVPRERALGTPCHSVFRTDLCRARCPLGESLRTGRTATNQEIEIRTATDVSRTISVNTSALVDDGGRFVGAVETFRDVSRERELERQLLDRWTFRDIVSRHEAVQRIFRQLPVLARSDAAVLIDGGTGTGKGLFARAVHDLSDRAAGPFVHLNLGALPDTLVEAELFGHVRGAFTDAKASRAGRVEAARGGTLFLDEIGDAPLAAQVKLLRLLQEREFEPLGTDRTVQADVRIVAATNRDLLALAESGRFRDDLYYRLSVFHLTIPDLRDRMDDVPLLAQHFIERHSLRSGRRLVGLTRGALGALVAYDYPGNVRELENVVEHACVMARDDRIGREDLPSSLVAGRSRHGAGAPGTTARRRARVDREEARAALARHAGNIPRAAAVLGVHRTTLWRMVRRWGL